MFSEFDTNKNYTYFILIFKVFLKWKKKSCICCTDKHFVFDLTLSIIWTFYNKPNYSILWGVKLKALWTLHSD